MRAALFIFFAVLMLAPQASAQTEQRFFGYYFGMTQAQARALTPNVEWHEAPAEAFAEEDRTGLFGMYVRTIAGVGFAIGLEFINNRLDRINMISGGPVGSADECNATLFSVVTALEVDFGAFTGGPMREEQLQDYFTRRTVRGGEVRVYGHPLIGVLGFSNARNGYFIEASSIYQITPWPDDPRPPCSLSIRIEPTAPSETPRRQAAPAPDAAAFDAAQSIETPQWVDAADERDVWSEYPRMAGMAGLDANVVLDCLVQDNGDLRCRVEAEDPEGAGFGEAARMVAEDYRMARTIDGVPTAGRRVHLPIVFTMPSREERERGY